LLEFPCDTLIEQIDDAYYRGITIEASPEIIFRWLCQLRVASYAQGRKDSPGLIPGLDQLAIGQPVMGFLEIASFDRNKQLTIRTKEGTPESRFYGEIAASYVISPVNENQCRLLVKSRIKYPRISGILLRLVLPWGDLFMMRRQLLNFKKLSEQMEKGQANS
jgi:hypothetical protein